jgi:hypothetical protein
MQRALAICVVLSMSSIAYAEEADSCVPTGEIVPVDVPLQETAADQVNRCLQLRKHFPNTLSPDSEVLWTECPGTRAKVLEALEYCRAPLVARVRVSPADVALALAAADQTPRACKNVFGGVTPQVAIPELPAAGVILDELAKFIVARAKAEAMAFLIEHLSDQICGNADGKALLPASCAVLASQPGGNAWGTLKVAFETDMKRFPERALACAAERAEASDTVQSLVYNAVQIARLLLEKNDPRKVVYGFRQADYTAAQCSKDRVGCGLHAFGFTAQLLSNISLKDEFTRQLVWRRILDELVRLELVTAAQATTLAQTPAALGQLVAALEKLATAADTFKDALDDTAKPDKLPAIADAVRDTIAFLEVSRVEVLGWLRVAFPDAATRLAELDRKAKAALALGTTALDTYAELAARKYAHMYVAVALAIGALSRTKVGKALEGKILKLLPFVIDVAEAKTADDVQRSLEAAAAPIGGGRAKRGATRRTIAVTALAGATLGGEISYATKGASDAGWQGGLFVPVGVDLTWGVGEIYSVGFFLSVIDLGALASFRAKDDVTSEGTTATVEKSPQIGWEQVVSPGLYFEWGIDRITLGAGVSMTPSLREVTADGVKLDSANALRFGVFAAIDVTIFPF